MRKRRTWLLAGLLGLALAWGMVFGQPSAPIQTRQAPAPAVADPGGHGGGG